MRKCFGKSARENALKLKKRTVSFFQRQEEEQEKTILKDILLREDAKDLIKHELEYRRYSQFNQGFGAKKGTITHIKELGYEEDESDIVNEDVLLLTEQMEEEDVEVVKLSDLE